MLFTVVNEAYLNLTLNWLCNTYAISKALHNHVLIVALNARTCEKLLDDWPKIKCISLESDPDHNDAINWGQNEYVQILNFRAQLMYALVEVGFIDIMGILSSLCTPTS